MDNGLHDILLEVISMAYAIMVNPIGYAVLIEHSTDLFCHFKVLIRITDEDIERILAASEDGDLSEDDFDNIVAAFE